MPSLLGALWVSTVTSGVIRHRLYFRPSQLSTGSNFRQAKAIKESYHNNSCNSINISPIFKK